MKDLNNFIEVELTKDKDIESFINALEKSYRREVEEGMIKDIVYFAKVREGAIIPSKRDEDAGYDIYANFSEESIIIQPHETRMIPTGIASACTPDYYFQLFERGSTGTKGIGQRCGVIDSGYRKEWICPITNHNEKPVVIMKNVDKFPKNHTQFYYDGGKKVECITYPYEKALCQAVLLPVPKVRINEISYEELMNIGSKRGLGCLGSSNK